MLLTFLLCYRKRWNTVRRKFVSLHHSLHVVDALERVRNDVSLIEPETHILVSGSNLYVVYNVMCILYSILGKSPSKSHLHLKVPVNCFLFSILHGTCILLFEPSHPVPTQQIPSHPTPSYPILWPILSYPIVSYSNILYCILS